jgi:hypothetical protein
LHKSVVQRRSGKPFGYKRPVFQAVFEEVARGRAVTFFRTIKQNFAAGILVGSGPVKLL